MGDTPLGYAREAAHPPLDWPPYKSTALRHPKQPPVHLPHAITEIPAARRATLLARPNDDGYRFDIRLQGPEETVFFDV